MRTFENIISEGLTENNLSALAEELEVLVKKQAELEEASANALLNSYHWKRMAKKMNAAFEDDSITGANIEKAYDMADKLKETHERLEEMLKEADDYIYMAKEILMESRA